MTHDKATDTDMFDKIIEAVIVVYGDGGDRYDFFVAFINILDEDQFEALYIMMINSEQLGQKPTPKDAAGSRAFYEGLNG